MGAGLTIALFALIVPAMGGSDLPPATAEVSETAFARALVPALLGRRARGVQEVAMIADVSTRLGREAAARMLMEEEEFLSYWSDALVDILEVNRGVGDEAHRPECYGERKRTQDDGGALAAFVRQNPPGVSIFSQPPTAAVPTPAPFNMVDLMRSAIELDDLSPVYQAYLFSLVARQTSSSNAKNDFMRIYLNRDLTCMGCHNRTFSTSNKEDEQGNVVWRRLWSIPANIEKALFGNFYDSLGAEAGLTSVLRGKSMEGIVPWGIEVECTSARGQDIRIYGAFAVPAAEAPGAHFASIDGATNPTANVLDLERSFRSGADVLAVSGLVRTTPPPVGVLTPTQATFCSFNEVIADTCTACHSGIGAPSGLDLSLDPATALVDVQGTGLAFDQTLVVPSDPESSAFYQIVVNGEMPMGSPPLSAADLQLIENWINAGAPGGDPEICSSSHVPEVDPDPAFAFQVAVTAVDRIWARVMGRRLTIDHGFSRNEGQLAALWYLTEDVFIPGGWSLSDVLVAIVTSDYFVRRSPALAPSSPYTLPMLWDPWIEADPTKPPPDDPLGARSHNGPGDLVHRFSGGDLVRATSFALGWREPSRFPAADGPWPGGLQVAMGRFRSPSEPGFRDVDFQSLLHWENDLGVCSKTGRSDDGEDWIDRLIAGKNASDAQNPGAPLTLAEAYRVLKDWLLQDPTIASQPYQGASPDVLTEEHALLALLNAELPADAQLALTMPTSAAGDGYLETKLREACGVLIKTPSFMLAGATPPSYTAGLPSAPRLRVCNAEPCEEAAMCESFAQSLQAIGREIYCVEGEFTTEAPPPPEPEPRPPPESSETKVPKPDKRYVLALKERAKLLASLCPAERCAFLPWERVSMCEKNPSLCRTPPVKYCDPRCSGPRCCGALPGDASAPGLLSVWAEGARVYRAASVSIARPGARSWVPLRRGTRLLAGDVLLVPRGSDLLIRDSLGSFGTPPPASSKTSSETKPKTETKTSSEAKTPRPTRTPIKVPISTPSKSPVRKRGISQKKVSSLVRPVVVSIVGKQKTPMVTKRAGARAIDPRALRAKQTQKSFLSRGTASREKARIARRAARLPPREDTRPQASEMAFHRLHAAPRPPPPPPVRPRPIQLDVRFDGAGEQAVFCPGARALRCEPSCRVALEEPESCSVLGTVSRSRVSGTLPVSRSGRLICSWQRGALSCTEPMSKAPGRR